MGRPWRAWGPLPWLLSKLGSRHWDFVGVLGTEERSCATFQALAGRQGRMLFLEIADPSDYRRSEVDGLLGVRRDLLLRSGAAPGQFSRVGLMDDIDTMREQVEAFISSGHGNVVLDITSMPKRWFFPVVRFLLKSVQVRTLVVTYASAASYGEQLSSDAAQLAPLPTFGGAVPLTRYDELIVGVGFAPQGLKEIYDNEIGKIRYLFPFPPGPPNFHRNWRFLQTLEEEVGNRNRSAEDRWQVHMYDVPGAFDAICRFTDNGLKSSALAPFGPKTLSLAMCLFALAAEASSGQQCEVLYSQPRRYSPEYSKGLKVVDGLPDIKAYCLRLDGVPLYKIPLQSPRVPLNVL